MTLQIGTILIAKEDAFMDTKEKCLTKGKEYIIKSLKGNAIVFESDFDENHEWLISEIDTDFTIKRYTLTDLKEKKIAVKLRNYEEYKRLCEAVGDENTYEFYFIGDETYYGVDKPDCIIQLNEYELKGRTLVHSIDLIDLEVKEELTTPVKVRTVEFLENLVRDYESEIARLKGDNEMLKSDLGIMVSQFEILQLRESPQISQNLEKRERMAWELWLGGGYTVEQATEKVNYFLAKSKEVGNGK